MSGTTVWTASATPSGYISPLCAKKLRAALGYDPIRNRIGEGYLMGGEEA